MGLQLISDIHETPYIAQGWSVALTIVVVELGGHNRAGTYDNQYHDLDIQHGDHTPSTNIQHYHQTQNFVYNPVCV